MPWSDYKVGDRIEVVSDHIRGGRVLATKGSQGEVKGHDYTMLNSYVREAWIVVRLDGKRRNRCLLSTDIQKINEVD